MPDREKLIRCLKYCADPAIDCQGCERWEYDCGSSYCVDDLMRKAAEALEQQRWIPVSEKMPDLELSNAKANDMDLLPCLCVIQHKRAKNGRYVTKLWYTGKGFIDGNSVYLDEVTHWMPLPEPPKGDH